MKASVKRVLTATVALLLASAAPALAHVNPAEHGSFLSGLTHPLFGLDHILAIVAVGLWAAMTGGRATWLVPGAFVGTMALGFALALGGAALPLVEPVILASVIALGFLVAAAVKLRVAIGMAVVAAFALFHGFAHGTEIGAATQLQYSMGFAAATVALHLVGVGIGRMANSGRLLSTGMGSVLARGFGGVTAVIGVGLAAGWV